ncbi:hypothetical protein ACE193_13215 [Bernardetia sp. OM2101]|uniref:hypothetical protein n=1 Tax=Bernardetia sp. OM2101 TaxID=3344876 RepID=UPI0035CEFC5F
MKYPFLLILTGIYSLLSTSEILSIRFDFISILIKLIFIGLLFWNVNSLYQKNYKAISIIFFSIGIMMTVFFLGIYKQVAFFPTFGDYQIAATYYDSKEKSISSQSRIEYFRKEYGLSDTAEKYEKIEVFLDFFESREVIYPNYEELKEIEFVEYHNNYRPV